MFDECPKCGKHQTDMSVDSSESVVVCPNCGNQEKIHQEPLLIVSGASGVGKSTVLRELQETRDDVVLLDSDVLWQDEFWKDSKLYFQTWLRLCRDIAQSKRPPVIFGTGFGVPSNLKAHPQYDCFSDIYYLVLVCDPNEQKRRLKTRPPNRQPDRFEPDEGYINEQVEFNQWLKSAADREDFAIVNTTNATIESTANQVDQWISDQI